MASGMPPAPRSRGGGKARPGVNPSLGTWSLQCFTTEHTRVSPFCGPSPLQAVECCAARGRLYPSSSPSQDAHSRPSTEREPKPEAGRVWAGPPGGEGEGRASPGDAACRPARPPPGGAPPGPLRPQLPLPTAAAPVPRVRTALALPAPPSKCYGTPHFIILRYSLTTENVGSLPPAAERVQRKDQAVKTCSLGACWVWEAPERALQQPGAGAMSVSRDLTVATVTCC